MNREIIGAIVSGLLFGAGLAVSGMADPIRVRGFLDILGSWDPTLVFVMGGAVLVMGLAWIVQGRMSEPLFRDQFSLPSKTDVDTPLIAGAILFGIGWGVAGLCPGPALIGLVLVPSSAVIFVLAMLAGMYIYQITMERK